MAQTPPEPGVSSLGGGPATPVSQVRAPQRRPRQNVRQDIAQAAIDRGAKEIPLGQPMTQGVKPTRRSVIEVPLNTGVVEFGIATWVSADGDTYQLRYGTSDRDGNMKFLPNAIDKLHWACLRELALDPSGNSVLSIFSAVKLKMVDEGGKVLFPVNIEMLRNARAGLPAVIAGEDKSDGVDPGFSIGSD
jgi:hypothetical protein